MNEEDRATIQDWMEKVEWNPVPYLDAIKPAVPVRAEVLRDAEKAVCNDPNAEYGEPIDNFGRWAGACNALGYQGPGGRPLKPHDLAVIMGLGKLSRSVQSPEKADTWTDLAGYAAVGYELVTLED